MPVDWNCETTSHIPHCDVPKNPTRKFPGIGEPRRIRVSILRYEIGIHYYVSVEAENNPFWNDSEQSWVVTSDDLDVREDHESKRFDSFNRAVKWLHLYCVKHFSDQKMYRVVDKWEEDFDWLDPETYPEELW